MRQIIFALMLGVLATPAAATPPPSGEFFSSEQVAGWMSNYRTKPDLVRVPAAVRALSRFGGFKDPESSGVYVGFLAGVIGANPAKAEELIGKMLPLPAGDQWAIIRAIAYSGHPDWMGLLGKFADRMPLRQVMIQKYIEGKLPTLDEIPLERKKPTLDGAGARLFQQAQGAVLERRDASTAVPSCSTRCGATISPPAPTVRSPASSRCCPGRRTATASTSSPSAAWPSTRSPANAARDMELLAMLKRMSRRQAKNVILNEVIEAAETMETTRVRKEALAALEELKRKGPGYKRDISTWGQVGQGALALGCIAAATTGQVQFGLPCVIGGATSAAVLNFWDKQQ